MMLLDEPTNHLDIEAIDSLAEAIKGFKVGPVIVTFHVIGVFPCLLLQDN
jgi:ATPase subunit of ABC transporter with duplicated ATPase domains